MPDDLKQLSKDEIKQAFKEALKEWLDERAGDLGWLSLKTIGVAILGALFYWILTMEGWHK